MEENKKQIKEILKQATVPSTSNEMAARVLQNWKEVKAVPLTEQPPLISKYTWWAISIAVVGLIAWVLSLGKSESVESPVSNFLQKFDFSMSFDFLSLSPIMLISAASFAFMIGVNIYVLNSRRNLTDTFLL